MDTGMKPGNNGWRRLLRDPGVPAALRDLVRKEFVYNIIFGNLYSHFAIQQFVELLDIVHLPNVVFVVQVDCTAEEAGQQLLLATRRRQIWQQLHTLFREKEDGIVTILGGNNLNHAMVEDREVAVLLPVHGPSPAAVERLAREYAQFLKSYLEHHLPFTVSIGIGRTYPELRDLHQSYREACQALDFKFYLGNSRVIHYHDVQVPPDQDSAFFVQMETRLVETLRHAQWERVEALVQELFHQMAVRHRVPPAVLRVRLLEMFTVLSRAAMDLGVESPPLLDLKVRVGEEIEQIATLEAMARWALQVVREIVDLIRERQMDTAAWAALRAQQYIAANYQRDLSLEEIARHCHLSPSYFSHLFREYTGQTLTAYIKRVRVEKAQQLLLTTDLSVGEIAREVGYQDPNYFSRVFKSVVGKTPYEYRTGKK